MKPTASQGLTRIQRVLLCSGIASSLLYIAIMAVARYQGYSPISQTVSELTAIGAPSRALVTPFEVASNVLMIAFGVGVWRSAGGKRALRIAGGLLVAWAGIGLAAGPFASMHPREILAAGGATLSDTLHIIVYGALAVLFMFLIIAFGATAFGRRFRLYSIGTILALLGFGALIFRDAPRIQANLPTPWAGLTERLSILVYMVWVAVFAMALMRAQAGEPTQRGTPEFLPWRGFKPTRLGKFSGRGLAVLAVLALLVASYEGISRP